MSTIEVRMDIIAYSNPCDEGEKRQTITLASKQNNHSFAKGYYSIFILVDPFMCTYVPAVDIGNTAATGTTTHYCHCWVLRHMMCGAI